MKIYTEKQSEDFLYKNGFRISRLFFAKTIKDIEKNKSKLVYPLVLKISSEKIVHKHKINGIIMNINNYNDVLKGFNRLKKIKDFQGVLIQKQTKGDEFLLGLKKTPEFGHVIALGYGKTQEQRENNTFFRVCPINKNDAIELIKEVTKEIKIDNQILIKQIIKLSNLSVKFPEIRELDINPLMVNKKISIVVDAQIVFE